MRLWRIIREVCEKRRQQDSLAATITVFLRTSMFKNQPQYSDSFSLTMPYPTSFTPELFLHARQCLKVIYKPGCQYQKVGVAVSHIALMKQCSTISSTTFL
ncbi:MAG: hypothetical protein ACR2H5_25485 [Ktedonobacteraceae bacterium]